MSLINQVLEDLDRRRLEDTVTPTSVDDLRSANMPQQTTTTRRSVYITLPILAVIATSGTVGYWFYSNPAPESKSQHVAANVLSQANSNNSVVKTPVETAIALPQQPSKITKPAVTQKNVTKATITPETAVKQAVVQSRTPVISTTTVVSADKTFVKKNAVPYSRQQRAELKYQSAYSQLKAKQYREAEQTLLTALNEQAEHIKARELLTGLYIQQGRWIEASEILRQGVTILPQQLSFRKLYARSLMQLNNNTLAIKTLTSNPPTVSADPEYFAMLAALYQRQGNHQLAAENYAAILKQNSTRGVWWVGLGISLEALGRMKEAGQAYQHARTSGNLQQDVARFANQRLLALEEINYPAE